MERLDLNSEMLQPMKEHLEAIINRLIVICAKGHKEAEINLKIDVDVMNRAEYNKGKMVKEWKEPSLKYQLSEKIKETKNTSKGILGEDYKLEIGTDDNITYVKKMSEQLSIDSMKEAM
jgi:hypothetical protein